MPSDRRRDDDGGDSVSVIVYLDERFRAHDALHAEQTRSLMAAVDQMNIRLSQMNEIRDSVNDLASRAVQRDYYERNHTELDKRIQLLERQSATKQALDTQNQELVRMRRNLFYTVAGGVMLLVADILITALKR